MQSPNFKKKTAALVLKSDAYWDGLPSCFKFTEDFYASFINHLSKLMNLEHYIVFQSGKNLLGTPVTEKAVSSFIYHLVANKDEMEEGNIVIYGSDTPKDGSVETRITKLEYTPSGSILVGLRMLTGPACGKPVTIKLPERVGHIWLLHLGYSNSCRSRYIYTTLGSCLPGLYAIFDVTTNARASSWQDSEWKLQENASVIQYNRSHILKYRMKYAPCPMFLDDMREDIFNYCASHCPHGWASCEASSHEAEWRRGTCSVCGKSEVWLPNANSLKCIACTNSEKSVPPTVFD